ncbi:phage baseplate assembly protein V [Maritalea porphyrae]|uniref:phage baseplate assembly protein V n=1 Tax=Maritalea porphyrae TaxID=880732 RepID=UPI0022AF4F0B|nr:phage baseplate assembly protein V [Maritalea porphyrae]MCZ4270720.1 phage baseplate assembly protein V [Maritalea porphyrae]
MSDIDEIYRMLGALLTRVVETDRKVAGQSFRGTVKEVDGAKQAVRLIIGQTPEGDDVLGPWVKVGQTAGSMSVHDLPSIGQQCEITCSNGDIEQGTVRPLHWSDDNPAISEDVAAKKLTLGAVTIDLTGDGMQVSVGGSYILITADGIWLNGAKVEALGAELLHNNVNVGDEHKHKDVTPGLEKTGFPV